jgi:hypothetical protein
VFQTDTAGFDPPADESDVDWKDFLARSRIDPGALYFEYGA